MAMMAHRRRRAVLRVLAGVAIGLLVANALAPAGDEEEEEWCRGMERRDAQPLRWMDEENARSSEKNLLFVGVMTAKKYLDNRAKAAYETWGKEVPGRVVFFSSEFSTSAHVPVVALKGVDDSYPPQKKSFEMLKYMHDHYVDQYEWFMRADDDVYIRTDKLEELLRSVDSRNPWFIGQTGRGNTEEFGLLSLEDDENFCMGGPGVIFSRETLRRVAPHADACLRALYTTHEDVEVGRCVRRFAGVSCTWSYEMQVILYHNQSGEAAFTGDLKQKEVHRAITLHPVKRPPYLHRLHKYVKGLEIQRKLQQSLLLHRDIAASMNELGYRITSLKDAELVPNMQLFPKKRGSEGYLGDTSLLGVSTGLKRYSPRRLRDVLEWELISKTLYSHRDANPRKRIGSSLKEGLGDVVREIMEIINSLSKQRGRVIEFKETLYGYWRLDPSHGVDLILDMLLVYKKYRGNKMTVQVRRHAYVQQTFTGIFVRECTDHLTTPGPTRPLPVHQKLVHTIFSKISENLKPILYQATSSNATFVNFILPLSGRSRTFERFLRNYEDVCIVAEENTRLYVVLYADSEEYEENVRSVEALRARRGEAAVNVLRTSGRFSRAKALQLGVDQVGDDDLMLFIDVDVVFDGRSLERFRRNALPSKKIYFPIVYSLYNPALLNESYLDSPYSDFTTDLIDDSHGFWRQFGFGVVSLYKSDYIDLGGLNLMISGWGYEDVTFFDNAVASRLKIIRSADPGLVHVFHSIRCDEQLDVEQRNMCVGTKASTLGSLGQLQKVLRRYRELLR